MQQLLLFPETFEASLIREIKELKASHKDTRLSTEKVRKGQFAKIGELNKKHTDLAIRLDTIQDGLVQTVDFLTKNYMDVCSKLENLEEELCKIRFHQENDCEIREMALM